MILITKSIERQLAATPMMSTEDKKPADIPVIVKFFFPAGRFTFYVTECEKVESGNLPDYRFFGFCVSPLGQDCDELGYISYQEMLTAKVNVKMGNMTARMSIERDRHYEGTLLDAFNAHGFTKFSGSITEDSAKNIS